MSLAFSDALEIAQHHLRTRYPDVLVQPRLSFEDAASWQVGWTTQSALDGDDLLLDAPIILVNKRTGEVFETYYLADAAHLNSMTPINY